MTCDPLADTGTGVQLGQLLTLAIACLAGGAVLLLMTRDGAGRSPWCCCSCSSALPPPIPHSL